MKLHTQLDAEAAPLWLIDPRPVDRLLQHYAPMGEKLAAIRARKNELVSPDEFRTAAMHGLWGAVTHFDPHNERGAAFSTFATWRINGALIECERSNDWIKPKIRIAHKRGEVAVPEMFPLSALDDAPVSEADDAWEQLSVLLHAADGVVRRFAHAMLDSRMDVDAMADRLHVSPYFAGSLSRWTIDRLRDVPCLC